MADTLNQRPTALITGGSRGIGLALAREFAGNGHDIVLVAREQAALEAAASQLRTRYDITVRTHVTDLSRAGRRPAIAQSVFAFLFRTGQG